MEPTKQEIHVMLKNAEGKGLTQKVEVLRSLGTRSKKQIGYLMIWQRAFEISPRQ